jgi:hypothetical protein
MAPNSWTHTRARIAALSRSRPPDDPELVELRLRLPLERADATRDDYAEYMFAAVARLIAQAPPLTDGQIARIDAILKNASRERVET